ncbi:MAG: phage virion morphogenesis protein [Alphaproteobacteria bacterium]
MKNRLQKSTRVASRIAQILHDETKHAFSSESSPIDGEPWKQLSPATVLIRQWGGFPGQHPILVRTGFLSDTIYTEHDESTATIVAPAAYAKGVHEVRPIVGLSSSGRQKAIEVITDGLFEGL